MKFKRYLTEVDVNAIGWPLNIFTPTVDRKASPSDDDTTHAEEIAKILEKDSKTMLKFMRNKKIGFDRYYSKFNGPDIGTYTPHKDRKPMDTPLEVHRAIDKEFNKIFGWKPRSQGVFTSVGDFEKMRFLPGRYGVFFPVGDFKAIYNSSGKIHDFYVWFRDQAYDYFNGGNWRSAGKKDKNMFMLNRIIPVIKSEYSNDLNKLTKTTRTEIMFKCNKYHLIRSEIFEVLEKQGFFK